MINIKNWIEIFVNRLEETFKKRIWFVGLQCSYARNEANENSDIDIVVILDKVDIQDLIIYRGMLDKLPNRDLICGFVSGKQELMNWSAADLFQFYYDTLPIIGSLDVLLNKITKSDIKNAIKSGACNIYHTVVHNFVHEISEEILKNIYKSAKFVIQAIYFYQTGKYVKDTLQLLEVVEMSEKIILQNYINIKINGQVDFELMCKDIFAWAKEIIKNY